MAPGGAFKGSENLPRVARGLLAVSLVVWLAWALADTIWLLVAGPTMLVPPDDDLPRLAPATERPDAGLSLASIQQWELFGPPVGPMAEAAPVEAPETRLRLELLGIFQHPDPGQASAIIAEQGKDGELFHPGDRVPGNATLEEVLVDRVILLRMGQREALRLKEPDLGGNVALSRPEPFRGPEAQVEMQDVPPDAAAPGGDLGEQRTMLINRLGLTPSEEGGYLIGDAAPEQVLQAVGLRPGDVLVSVNGYELGTETNDMAALEEFRNSGSATIVVQRGPQRFTVNYPP